MLTELVLAQCGKFFFSRSELVLWVEGGADRRDALLKPKNGS